MAIVKNVLVVAEHDHGTLKGATLIKVVTVRTTSFDPAAATGGSGTIKKIDAVADNGMSAFVGAEIAQLDRPELTAATIFVSGGRALGSSDKFNEVLTPLADKLGASRLVADLFAAAPELVEAL